MWSGYGQCSETCQSGAQSPTQQRTRTCDGATFGGNCNGASLEETQDCNAGVACPGKYFIILYKCSLICAVLKSTACKNM